MWNFQLRQAAQEVMLSLSLIVLFSVRLSVRLSSFFSLVYFEVCSTFDMSLGIKECRTDKIGVNVFFMDFSRVFPGSFKVVSRKF